MTIRKRKQPTPHFKLPPPFHPITGEHEPLAELGKFPYCALMEIAATDDHANYVICSGYDPRIGKFIDYELGNADKPGIPVAKPFTGRFVNAYVVGEIYPAVLPLTVLGQNPGVDSILYTDEGVVINWLLLTAGTYQDDSLKELARATFDEALATTDASISGTLTDQWGAGRAHDSTSVTLYNFLTDVPGEYEFYGAEGAACICGYRGTGTDWQIIIVQCPPEEA